MTIEIDLIKDADIVKIDTELLAKSGIDYEIDKTYKTITIKDADGFYYKAKGVEIEKNGKFYYLLLEDAEQIEVKRG